MGVGHDYARRAARSLASRPALTCVVSFFGAVLLAVVGIIAGEFEVDADNEGWESRGTSVADRALQAASFRNCYDDPELAPSDCWDLHDGKRRRAARRLTQSNDFWYWNQWRGQDLVVVYRARDSAATLLSEDLLLEVCQLEEQISTFDGYEDICLRANFNQCAKPLSVVSLLRQEVSGGWGMSCEDLLSSAGTTVADGAAQIGACRAADNCEETIGGSFDGTIGSDLRPSNDNRTTTLATVFPMSGDFNRVVDALLSAHKDGKLSVSSSGVKTAHDTKDEELSGRMTDEYLLEDMNLVSLSMVISLGLLFAHTRSVFLSLMGLMQVILSFPVAFFLYKLVIGFQFFPFLNFMGLFVILGIGIDDVFVTVDKWEQAVVRRAAQGTSLSEVDVAEEVGVDAAHAMLLTSVTTSAAFFATTVVPVAPIRAFAIFMGSMVIVDYVLCILITLPAQILQHRWLNSGSSTTIGRAMLDYKQCCCCRKGTGEDAAPKKPLVDRIFEGPVHTAVHVGRYPLILIFLGLAAGCAMLSADIPLPTSSEVQILPDDNNFTLFSKWSKDLARNDDGEDWVAVYWGLKAEDTGDVNNPYDKTELVQDTSFDPSLPVVQQWLLQFCERTRSNAAVTFDAGSSCVLEEFNRWLSYSGGRQECAQTTSLPLPQTAFHGCAAAFLDDNHWARRDMRMRDGEVAVVSFQFRSYVRWDSSFDKLQDVTDAWDAWIAAENAGAPSGATNGWFSSDALHWYDTNKSMRDGAYLSSLTALACVVCIVIVSTRDLRITLYATVAVAAVLLYVVGTTVLMGWTLGFLEGICFSILIGLSCDFVLHMAHAYTEADAWSRVDRTRLAAARMGPPVLFGALTTMCAGAVMFGCTILFYLKFGTILLLTMLYAVIVSVTFFLAMTDAAGPQWGSHDTADNKPAV